MHYFLMRAFSMLVSPPHTHSGYPVWLRQSSPILLTVAKGRQSGRRVLAARVRRHGGPGAARAVKPIEVD